MTFNKRKSALHRAAAQPKKSRVVSVRLDDSDYKTALENCRASGRKLSDFWRRALTGTRITPIATPEDMALLRQIGSEANNLNQLATEAHRAGYLKVKWDLEALSKKIKGLYNQLSDDWKHK